MANPSAAGKVIRSARSGFDDALPFHRVIDEFMLQFSCPKQMTKATVREA